MSTLEAPLKPKPRSKPTKERPAEFELITWFDNYVGSKYRIVKFSRVRGGRYSYHIYKESTKRERVRNARRMVYHIRAGLYGMDYYNGPRGKVLAVDHKVYLHSADALSGD